jgi:hypothetical protein
MHTSPYLRDSSQNCRSWPCTVCLNVCSSKTHVELCTNCETEQLIGPERATGPDQPPLWILEDGDWTEGKKTKDWVLHCHVNAVRYGPNALDKSER